jgi:NhaP-type Na+/H+ or K+/H+ antiporter
VWYNAQAAIGPVALDIARKIHSAQDEAYARTVLIVVVLAILITAPIGATLITVLGPRLLEQEASTSPAATCSELPQPGTSGRKDPEQ